MGKENDHDYLAVVKHSLSRKSNYPIYLENDDAAINGCKGISNIYDNNPVDLYKKIDDSFVILKKNITAD